MKNKLLAFPILLFVFSIVLTSCSHDYHLERVGHFPKTKSSSAIAEKKPATSKQHDVINAMKTAQDERQLTASDNSSAGIVEQQFTQAQPTVPFHLTAKEEKKVEKIFDRIDKQAAKNNSQWEKPTALNENNRQSEKAMRTSDNQLLYAVISFFIPPLGVALYEGGITTNFWIDLILTLLFWLPGFIFALIVILG